MHWLARLVASLGSGIVQRVYRRQSYQLNSNII